MQKKVSKFPILFIFLLIIPGLVLTTFSIQNISSQRFLTENSLRENQKILATEIDREFMLRLTNMVFSFSARLDTLSPFDHTSFKALDSMKYVHQTVIMDQHANFIWPFYQGENFKQNLPRKSASFLSVFATGESFEFLENNDGLAIDSYQKALTCAVIAEEKAAAINAIARVLTKKADADYRLSFIWYEKLLLEFGSVLDESGLLYMEYAVHQLIELSADISQQKIGKLFGTVLHQMATGSIPLTPRTEILLTRIQTWIQETHSQIGPSKASEIEQIRRMIQYSTVFETAKHSGFQSFPVENSHGRSYQMVLARHNNRSRLFLGCETSKAELAGFFLDHTRLFKDLILDQSKQIQQLDADIRLITEMTVSDSTPGILSITHPISPFIQDWEILVQPKNPGSVRRLILRQRWTYGLATSLLLAGMLLGIGLIVRDVTREKRLAQLQSDFVSNVTHELKTPITSIRMYAETIRLGRIKNMEQQKDYLSTIVHESERLTRLVNNVLDFNKMEAGRKQYTKTRVNLAEIVERTLFTMEYWLKEEGFRVEKQIEADVVIQADGDALEQAVLNLISNAMKYSDKQKEIKIRLTRSRDGIIRLEIEDKGVGIPDTKRALIFDKYYRVQAESTRNQGGAGLGLTVVKHIVEAHHGQIEVMSEIGKGSRFILVFPTGQSEI